MRTASFNPRTARTLQSVRTMKVAIPTWTGRVSPVFDVAKRLLVVKLEGGGEVSREEAVIEETQFMARAKAVTQLGIDVLICGAFPAQDPPTGSRRTTERGRMCR